MKEKIKDLRTDPGMTDIPETGQKERPELPAMRNNDQRKEFLAKYQAWPVWFEVPQASEVYHRFDLPDGSSRTKRWNDAEDKDICWFD